MTEGKEKIGRQEIEGIAKLARLRISEEDIPKMAVQTSYRHYKLLVLPFGLTNNPTIFTNFMNQVFKP